MKKEKHEHRIKAVRPGSIAEEMQIGSGDKLLAIDGQEIRDVFDYYFLTGEENIVLLIEKMNGEQWELEIEKEADEELGLSLSRG